MTKSKDYIAVRRVTYIPLAAIVGVRPNRDGNAVLLTDKGATATLEPYEEVMKTLYGGSEEEVRQ